MTLTVLDQGRVTVVDGSVGGGRVMVDDVSLTRATGFVRKPEGLCRGEVCIPVRPGSGLDDNAVDLVAVASVLGRPIAVDEDAGAVYLGPAATERAAVLRSGRAPDFTLPDLDGRLHSLSDLLGRKVVLAVYGSW
ncbi:MAG TPA: hypothetical protein VM030_10175 [Acidimicrobiales bacterium]|nr:hypothetical protein [Acidimicrobiales bacterium]